MRPTSPSLGRTDSERARVFGRRLPADKRVNTISFPLDRPIIALIYLYWSSKMRRYFQLIYCCIYWRTLPTSRHSVRYFDSTVISVTVHLSKDAAVLVHAFSRLESTDRSAPV